MTDIAASIGIVQLRRSEELRLQRENIAKFYSDHFADIAEIELPAWPENRLHSWHLYPIKLRLDKLSISRNEFIDQLRSEKVGYSVHWRPLHLHTYYQENFGWTANDLPVATAQWERLISLPLFPGITGAELNHVVNTVRKLCTKFAS